MPESSRLRVGALLLDQDQSASNGRQFGDSG